MKIKLGIMKERRVFQNIVIEIVADLTMLTMGIVIGYYFKTLMF